MYVCVKERERGRERAFGLRLVHQSVFFSFFLFFFLFSFLSFFLLCLNGDDSLLWLFVRADGGDNVSLKES